ncbi:hypothetical protein Q3G72_027717 [Acer saccharum]|nr:hypothetical protein Q3G72_027717 [Acer saccharum]
MRTLASQFSSEAERNIGWLLKLFFAGTAAAVGYQFFPYMGDNLMQQSVSLLRVKDPLFKRMGASRLARFATDDERRMKIVEIGGAQELLNMLEAARDDRTQKEALKALAAISRSGTHSPSSLDSSSGRKLRTTQSPLQHISNFKVLGRYYSESFRFYKGETVIAEVNHNFTWESFCKGKETFKVKVYPGVDYAFIVALIVIVNENDAI